MICWAGFGDNPLAQRFANELGERTIAATTRISTKTGVFHPEDFYSIREGQFIQQKKYDYDFWLENPNTEKVYMELGTWYGFPPQK